MRPKPKKFALCVWLLCLTHAFSANATCPLNTLYTNETSFTSSDPVQRISISRPCPYETGGTVSAGAEYNLTAGFTSANAYGPDFCGDHAYAHTHDVFTLHGPATTSPIDFTAQIQLNVFAGGSGVRSARVSLRLDQSDSTSLGGGSDQTATIALHVSRRVGESFDLYVESDASAGDTGGIGVDTYLNFPDLPPGYVVTSCQGFVSDPAMDAKAMTWGRLKSMYR